VGHRGGRAARRSVVRPYGPGAGGFSFSGDGHLLATTGADNAVRLWDVATRQSHGPPLAGHVNWVRSVAFSPDGGLLATASADQRVRLWDVATSQPRGEPLTGHTNWVQSVAFSPDGTLLASASDDQTVRLWDPVSGRAIDQLTHTNRVNGVAFSRDGGQFATASDDGTVRLWRTEESISVSRRFAGHTGPVQDAGSACDECARRHCVVSADRLDAHGETAAAHITRGGEPALCPSAAATTYVGRPLQPQCGRPGSTRTLSRRGRGRLSGGPRSCPAVLRDALDATWPKSPRAARQRFAPPQARGRRSRPAGLQARDRRS
jgi:WD domain, G-beta repeat